MTTLVSLLLFLILSSSTVTRAQERAPHGLAYESPMAISPEAYDFFHPDTQPQRGNAPCFSPECSTLPEAATVLSTPAHESTAPPDASKKRLGAGSIASIPIGLVFALLAGVGVYYVVMTRQTNAARAKAAQQLQPAV
ncbi:unnamed protein product [Coffea canephora]|uniref:Transmembrane protein n=2 Tax=Coffea TaxID=13442 RepID=A0A068UFR4_COFCA|nr:unnamed protein product [Coffea canephora]